MTDPSTPGLYVLVHPNGSKYWCFRYWYSGRERLQALECIRLSH
ncbi:Arm DNA-binding domain-containing protein [Escherichia coli]